MYENIQVTEYRIGISGWRYAPWRKHFYPEGLVQKRELYFASRSVNSIEINGSFYALQTPERYESWRDETPDDFVFSVKAPKFITHIRRLRDIDGPVGNFFASGVLHLKHKLGPILWQFPPSFKFDESLFERFLQLLPRDSEAASTIMTQGHPKLKNPLAKNQPLRHCVEIRNPTFVNAAFIELLRKFNVALVIADSAGRWPYAEDITSDFIYMRLHGDAELYRSGYSDSAINRWFARIKTWSSGGEPTDAHKILDKNARKRKSRDIFCYFDNTDKLWAPYDARKLLAKLDLLNDLPAEPGIPMEE